MHFEVPKAKRFKEFGGEYVMIVISILTALALEHAVQTWHHRHLAHEAADKMAVELRENIKDVKAVLAYNEPKLKALLQVRNQMLAGIRGKTGDAELMHRFEQEWMNVVRMDLQRPTLRREAWEAAVANQAVTWMPREVLERYAGIYGWIRDTGGMANTGLPAFVDGPRLADVMSNVQMGSSNPQEIYRAVNQLIDAYSNLDGNLQALNTMMQKVLDESDGGHTAAPAKK
jgi:flagellar hook-basal body complex protein FliE